MSNRKPYRILICRPDRIGDCVLATPLPREIKKAMPDAFVAMLVREATAPVFYNNPHIDSIITLPDANPLRSSDVSCRFAFDLIADIRSYFFTHAFILFPNGYINKILFFAGIPLRVGVGHKLYQTLTNTKSVFRRKYKNLRSETDYCFDLLRKIGIEPASSKPEVFLTGAQKKRAAELKKKYSENGRLKVIGIHSSSGGSTPNMPVSEYVRLSEALSAVSTVRLLFTDFQIPLELSSIPNTISDADHSSPVDLMVGLSTLDLFISSSTGPMHLASALGIPTLTPYCPLPTCSPKLWGPLMDTAHFILPEPEYCAAKCPIDSKKCSFSGEGGINADAVLRSIREILSL